MIMGRHRPRSRRLRSRPPPCAGRARGGEFPGLRLPGPAAVCAASSHAGHGHRRVRIRRSTTAAPARRAPATTALGIDREVDISRRDRPRRRGLAAIRPDAVIHLAALSSVAHSLRAPEDCYRVNFLGTRALLDERRRRGARGPGPADRLRRRLHGDEPAVAAPRRVDAAPPALPLRPHQGGGRDAGPPGRPRAASTSSACARSTTRAPVNPTSSSSRASRARSPRSGAAAQAPLLRVGNLDSVRDFLHVDDVVDAYLGAARPARAGRRLPRGRRRSGSPFARCSKRCSGSPASTPADRGRSRALPADRLARRRRVAPAPGDRLAAPHPARHAAARGLRGLARPGRCATDARLAKWPRASPSPGRLHRCSAARSSDRPNRRAPADRAPAGRTARSRRPPPRASSSSRPARIKLPPRSTRRAISPAIGSSSRFSRFATTRPKPGCTSIRSIGAHAKRTRAASPLPRAASSAASIAIASRSKPRAESPRRARPPRAPGSRSPSRRRACA